MNDKEINQVDVSIVIVNYKAVSLILNCLDSIQQLTQEVSYEIIVVDNNSNDDFELRIQERYPKVICVSLSENIGFGRANNEGVKIANGRNVLFLNPDTILLNDAISILSRYIDSHLFVGACGGNLYDVNLRPHHSFRRWLPGIQWELNGLFHDYIARACWGRNRMHNFTNKIMRVGYITGADLMMPRDIFNQIGGFSPDFFMYYEETELCYRLKCKSFEIHSVPQARIQHLEGGCFEDEISDWKIWCEEHGHVTYYKLTSTFFVTYMALSLHCITLLSRIPFYFFSNKKRMSVLIKRIKCIVSLIQSNS